jgi:hypothetical protein
VQPVYHPLRIIFGNPERLVVPLFQRPYVWDEKDQWEPLWIDVRAVADRVAAGGHIKGHFLGSVVLEQRLNIPGTLPQRHVIDGQQRLTTLQILLRAAAHAMGATAKALGADPAAEPRRTAEVISRQVGALTLNANVVDSEEAYKVWPTNDDREAYRLVMEASEPEQLKTHTHRLPTAYRFFQSAIGAYLEGDDGTRVRALGAALQDHLRMIVMSLDDGDEPQAIFETLNARGTPLLPADLVKNWLLWKAQRSGENVDALYHQYWKPFDSDADYWRASIGTGHASRARADSMIVNWLTERTMAAVPVKQVYENFLSYVGHPERSARSAGDWMAEIRAVSLRYRRIDEPSNDKDRFTTFLRRLRVLDVGTLYPLLLHVLGRPGSDSADLDAIAEMLESYIVRRTICGMNTRGYGNEFIKWVARIAEIGPDIAAAPAIRAMLCNDLGTSLRWPTDAEFKESVVSRPLYGYIRRERLLLVLEALEEARRAAVSNKTPMVPLGHLQLEHVMPKAWQKHWPLSSAGPDAIVKRDVLVDTLGNLTLVMSGLNAAMSNAPWLHSDPNLSKRAALDEHDVLFLNREIVNYGQEKRQVWEEANITDRAQALAARAIKIWPGPSTAAAPSLTHEVQGQMAE